MCFTETLCTKSLIKSTVIKMTRQQKITACNSTDNPVKIMCMPILTRGAQQVPISH